MSALTFKTESEESLPPDESKSGDIFSRLGYDIDDAVADIVDNSVDAQASAVHIRFVRTNDGIHSVIISDNGNGMSEDGLREAMRFGSRSRKTATQLGKYGIGLKSASLSQAEVVTVLTRQGPHFHGRRWKLSNVKSNWTCEILRAGDVKSAFNVDYGEFRITKSGTIVIWERLEHLHALPNHVDKVLARTIKEIQTELGIRFHRFLDGDKLSISIDQQYALDEPTGLPTYIRPLDPFSYEASGHKDYPVKLKLRIGSTALTAECHIWPPKSNAPGYKLGGGKVALRQGFYFYRNDRIIQAGGWNKLRADDSEPHLSLARVRIDLPAELDSLFKLDVTKSRLDPTPEFMNALLTTKSKEGVTFEQYLLISDAVYRKQKKKEGGRFPLIPGTGFTTSAQKAIATILKERGAGMPSKIAFKWSRLHEDEIVRIDPAAKTIEINSKFRRQISEGGSNDAPVLKMALLFLLQDEFKKSFARQVSTEKIQLMNQALIASLRD